MVQEVLWCHGIQDDGTWESNNFPEWEGEVDYVQEGDFGSDVPEFGSDIQGTKPIVFSVGEDEDKLREALQRSQDQFGTNATLLYARGLPTSMTEICKRTGKEKGGPWDCYYAPDFFGWEAQ